MRLTTAMLTAAVLALSAQIQAADFMQTVTGEAPLKSEQDEAACAKQAEAALAGPRADLEKDCQQDNGLFNYGLVTTEIHARSCTASQTLTCSGTASSAAAAAQAKAAQAASETNQKDEHKGELAPLQAPAGKPKKKSKPSRIKRLGPAPSDDELAPKPDARPKRRRRPGLSPATEVREVRAGPVPASTGQTP